MRVAVKDLIDMKGEVTTAGSEYLQKHSPPAKADAECLRIIRERNVAIVGKTNLTEFAVGVSGVNQYFGTPVNPLTDRRRIIPGGSSSGSAVAVASDFADVALGTDTAGSIRVPAACCGIAGLKTTFGLISLKGVYPISPTHLDTVGPMARDIGNLALGMDLLETGFLQKYKAAVAARPTGAKIRVGRVYLNGTAKRVDQAIDRALATSGFEVVPLGTGFRDRWDEATRDGAVIAAADAWVYDQKFWQQPGISTRTKAIVLLGGYQFRANRDEALARVPGWRAYLRDTFRRVDVIALPTLQDLPPAVPLFGGTAAFEARVLAMQNTVAVNVAGNPALAIPVPVEDRVIPVTSVQLVGPPRSEAMLLNVGRIIEHYTGPQVPEAKLAEANR